MVSLQKIFAVVAVFVVFAMCVVNAGATEEERRERRKNKKNRDRAGNGDRERNRDRVQTLEDADQLCTRKPKNTLKLKYLKQMKENTEDAEWIAAIRLQTHEAVSGVVGLPDTTTNGPFVSCPVERSNSVSSYDRNRWPHTIHHVQCKCDQCDFTPKTIADLIPSNPPMQCPEERDESSSSATASPIGTCQEVYRRIPVLRRAGCVDDFPKFVWDVEKVAVSCQCVLDIGGLSNDE